MYAANELEIEAKWTAFRLKMRRGRDRPQAKQCFRLIPHWARHNIND